ncbi:MAG TPA: GH3 auxin-responsive promoter family protein [Cyclobacteriaceae bacterium]|nr:GH3 auxin-responsive promoter family protein [Cyclobacteriaceae bacterium]
MTLVNSIISSYIGPRLKQIAWYERNAVEIQHRQFSDLVSAARDTEFGREHGFGDIRDIPGFRNRVPVRNYENLYPYIERLLRGEVNVLWPSGVNWFAKSSGTTNDRSKFIPVTTEALRDCHFRGGRDLLYIYLQQNPATRIFSGRGLTIGGSRQVNKLNNSSESYHGDLSAILIYNLPFWSQWLKTPPRDVALMHEWEKKIEVMASITARKNVTCIFGVPTWTVVLIQKILSNTGAKNILEVWPNLEVFFHGAVSFIPYEPLFRELIPGNQMHYIETYNASEGFFGMQDRENTRDLLLMLDYGIYYEFIPAEFADSDNPPATDISGVEIGVNYAMVISTNAGLWRYKIGDTIKFTSKNPYRIRITGRTKHFINAFGEELIVENAEQGISEACRRTGAIIGDYTAAPRYIGQEQKGGHEWIIEFKKSPDDLDKFIDVLDETMRRLNSDYDAKRYKDIALARPLIHPVSEGTFYSWMKKRNKLGGQHKVPRLVNSREYVDDILRMLVES